MLTRFARFGVCCSIFALIAGCDIADPRVHRDGVRAAVMNATITQTLLTAGTNIVNQQVYTTAAIAPASNTLITIAVLEHSSLGTPPAPTVSGGGMTTWTEVANVTFDPVATPARRLTIFRAMSAAPGSGTITITSSMTLSHCQWIVSQWSGVETSGVNGAGAIVQTGSNRGDAVNGLTVQLAAFGNANNVAYGVFGVRSAAAVVTPGAGFTEIAEQPSGESTPGDLEAEWATNLSAVAATWTVLNGGALGVEIKAAVGAPGPVDPAVSTVSATSPIVAGSGTSTITVTAKDANGNPISGATVVLAATGSGNTLTQPSSTTNSSGVATGTLSSTVTGTKTVSATANGTAITQTAAVTVNPGPISASQSTVSASPTSITAGSGTSTITVTAKDANGNSISGATVVLAATGTGNTLTQPAAATDANGVATGSLSSTVAETKTVSATAAGTAITQTGTVTVTSAPSAQWGPGILQWIQPMPLSTGPTYTMGPTDPWQTKANALLPGETLYLLPGTYGALGTSFIWTAAGTSGAPVTISGVPGSARPVIRGKTTLRGAWQRWTASVFAGPTGNVGGPGPNGEAILVNLEASHLEISNCEVYGDQWHAGIGANVDISDYRILNCYIHDNGGLNGDYNDAQNNTSHGLYLSPSTYGLIANCVIEHNDAKGLMGRHESHHLLIVHNTIVANGRHGSESFEQAHDWTWANNIVLNNGNVKGGTGIDMGGTGTPTSPPNFLIRRVVFYNNGPNGTSNWSGTGTVSEPLVADPLLVRPAVYTDHQDPAPNWDHHLLAGSPAIGRGDPFYAMPFDFDGRPRDMAAPDAGAYQH
jgi:hypothetical protein